ncbi:homoserine kinase [Psychromonas sp. CNPT3]|uniref:homoserine kinase n=1 Tax=Psychromonas sp. CNPT3 TaxID=314282 RepID=UPI00006E83E9|nr:homoserine kinase [Psychromonas sp. CNPT3]AGH80699.1 homoserine kinase [Psychromonas sp. CNPT3]
MSIVVYAPASSANISVGFDALGAAMTPINATHLGDRVQIGSAEVAFDFSSIGPFAHKLPQPPQQNIVVDCYEAFKEALLATDVTLLPVSMVLEKNLPVGSGLGSSSSSIVAALVALNAWHKYPLDEITLLGLMGAMEGKISGGVHYDNVAPSYLGGMQLMIMENNVISQKIPSFKDWYWVLAYPGTSISTAGARDILPKQYSLADTLTYGRRLSAFVHASYTQQASMAAKLLQEDVIAENYRAQLIPGFLAAKTFSKRCGALAMGISGSGPTIFSVFNDIKKAQEMEQWLINNFLQNEEGFCHVCQLDEQGAHVFEGKL